MSTPLELSYALCHDVSRRHGTTYYWATRLLPERKRRHVHAIYAFCRHADDVVDAMDADVTVEARRDALSGYGERFFADLERGSSSHPLLAAVVDTTLTCGIDPSCYRRFLRSMAMDLSVVGYTTWDDLCVYMDGSAAVIGEMMLPILEPRDPAAVGPARDLGLAFQLTNFLRDVGEDLDRGRVYLPQQDLERFGAAPWSRRVTASWRALMAFEIDRARLLYASADTGLELLPGRSARCIATARQLYSRILDRIEDADYDVFSVRARVPTAHKVWTAARGLAGLVRAAP